MNVRPGTIADLDRCQRLDSAYSTEAVWQMEEVATPERVGATFRRTRIPHRLQVSYPLQNKDMRQDWEHSDCFLVADELGTILGYLSLSVSHWQWQGWIEHLIVHRPYRRQGIATQLLHAAEHWARGSELRALIGVMQTKNDPSICLFSKLGYSFSGFIDPYYSNGDIGILYSLKLV
jgi:GNAT superfamily N-acetyltransferase